MLAHVERALAAFNGRRGDARSFDALDALLSAQAYRLAYWRVAAEEINYRRFFDINELAATRMEDPEVFALSHAYAFDLLKQGYIDGFRIDHVDGLYDPRDYLARLRGEAEHAYLVVEKILGAAEALPDWPVDGTTGYEFMVSVNGLFVDARNAAAIDEVYDRFTRMKVPFRELAYRGKQLVLRMSMASELSVLASGLNRFSERNRHYRDFTLASLVYALREIIASFPVYRTYVTDRDEPSPRDRAYIEEAAREAKRRNPGRPGVVFDFVRDLLLKKADYIPASERESHMKFVGKFQQVTSPVTAKGIEDTALYIFNRLVSLNDVGGEPDRFGMAPAALHDWMAERAERWPHGLSASSTHDTKRSEDVRARINVLSELPGAWKQALSRWARLNRKAHTAIDGESYPSRNEAYLLYQTLVGTWPGSMSTADEEQYAARVESYMLKAMREAKVFTSWLNPSEPHEAAMSRFVRAVLAADNTAFRADFLAFQRDIARWGLYNSLSQLAIKVAAPGVPDFYQGSEVWDLSLVDPDNRRPVDYRRLQSLLHDVDEARSTDSAALFDQLLAGPEDPRLKLLVTALLLRARRERHELFERGGYTRLAAEGERRDHLFAFLRHHEGQQVVLAVPRLIASLTRNVMQPPIGERLWGDTRLALPGTPNVRHFRDLLTGRCLAVQRDDAGPFLPAAGVFEHFPIGLLEAI